MSQEKRTSKATGKKGVTTKKSEEGPALEATPPPIVATVSASRKSPKAKPMAKAKPLQVSLEDIIRLRAYEIYLQRGATPGNPHEDWDVAEREVRAHFGQEADA
jgi:hypothetical protein